MQILITSSASARTRVWRFTPWSLGLAVLATTLPLTLLCLVLYHAVVLKAAHEHWPIISQAVRFVERQELARRDRYLRENLDAMAQKVGEMQARMTQLELVSERVAGMAGLKGDELKRIEGVPLQASGGPLVELRPPSASASTLDELSARVDQLSTWSERSADAFTLIEARLTEKRLQALMIPSSAPVQGPVGSGFGFRTDPFTHGTALHTGLDFPADVGTSILAAAGGVVLSAGPHPQYGLLVELDHGNGLVTRYAHTSKMLVHQGDLVKRGQKIAEVGTTGRSTGPHLHFEVLMGGVQQDPAKFLAGPAKAPAPALALAKARATP